MLFLRYHEKSIGNKLSRFKSIILNHYFYHNSSNRVVITGLGLITPLGKGVSNNWNALISGKSGIRQLKKDDLPQNQRHCYDALTSKVVARVSETALDEKDPSVKKLFGVSVPFIEYANIAAEEALKNANWFPNTLDDKINTGTSIGVGMSSVNEISNIGQLIENNSIKKTSPYFIARTLPNMASGSISIKYGFMGPNYCSSSACSAGAHAIGDAYNAIRNKAAKLMVAGGAESCIDAVTFMGFGKMRALSTKFNDDPQKASRPFDDLRDGFVLGEGAGIMILEDYEHAIGRNAKIYAELYGYGTSGDGYHITHPQPQGLGAQLAMKRAISNLKKEYIKNVKYINAHATSTPIGDDIELKAINSVFGKQINEDAVSYVSSTKGAIGHLLGASGAVEAVYTVLAIANRVAPPTLNLNISNSNEIVRNLIVEREHYFDNSPMAALSNSFGFGGTNVSLLFLSPEFHQLSR